QIGAYSVAGTFAGVLQVVCSGINQAWAPFYLEAWKSGRGADEKTSRALALFLVVVGGACFAGVLFGGDLVAAVMPARHLPAIPFLGPLLVGQLIMGIYLFAVQPIFARDDVR